METRAEKIKVNPQVSKDDKETEGNKTGKGGKSVRKKRRPRKKLRQAVKLEAYPCVISRDFERGKNTEKGIKEVTLFARYRP